MKQSPHWPHTAQEPLLLAGMVSSDQEGNKTERVQK